MLRLMMAANSASPTDPIAAAILGKLTCWWELTEESGVRADIHGDAPLSPMNGVGVADGLRAGNAALLSGNATLDAPLVTSTSIPPGGGDHCVFGWLYLNANTGSQTFASNWNSSSAASMEYLARIESGNIDFYNGGSSYVFARSAVPTAGAWHFYVGWRDSADGKVRLQVDNGSVAVSASASNPTVQNRILRFGRMNGRIQRWGWIKGGGSERRGARMAVQRGPRANLCRNGLHGLVRKRKGAVMAPCPYSTHFVFSQPNRGPWYVCTTLLNSSHLVSLPILVGNIENLVTTL